MRRFLALPGIALLLATMIVTPAAARGVAHHTAAHAFTVGLVTDVGGINDKSFNHLAYLGFQQAGTLYHIKGTYVESHAPTDYVPNLTYYARQGTGLTIGVGFLMASAMYQVARQFPHRKFAIIDSAPADAKGNPHNLKNVANLFFKEQESGYLVGVLSGLMEKDHVGRAMHNTIGYMGGVSIPPVNRYIAGYIQGARKVDPTIGIRGNYSQSFIDQAKGKQIGLQQISSGTDILFAVAGSSGLGYLEAAHERSVYGIGVDADQGGLGPYVITSALKKVDVAVRLIIRQAQTGHFRAGDHLFSLKNSGTGFAPPARIVPRSIISQVNVYRRLILSGKIVPTTVIH
ncbi:MAG: BMP family lipoprotein [Chloroflexota bacterium]|nr:MAG: BMP family ABC transporter substrate-binding protein [Chloroflexota bacterium]